MMDSKHFLAALCIAASPLAHAQNDETTNEPAGEIAFMRDKKVWIVDVATGEEHMLIDQTQHNRPLVWSPDGEVLLFWDHSTVGWNFWTVRADGSDITQLTHTRGGGYRSAAYSPDGSSIAFMRDAPMGVFIMDADGSNERQLTNHGHRDEPPSFSPDGSRLAFYDLGDGETGRSRGIYIVAANRGDELPIDSFLVAGDDPRWSPVDDRLLFIGRGVEEKRDVFIKSLNRNELKNLTRSSENELRPAWSPDGAHVVFGRKRDEGVYDLAVIPSEGGEVRVLGTVQGALFPPVWSPDGRFIAYVSNAKEEKSLFVVDVEHGKARMIARGEVWFPAWRPTPSKQSTTTQPEKSN